MIELFVFQSALREYLRLKRLIIWILLGLGAFALAAAWKRGTNTAAPDMIYSQVSEIMVFRVLSLVSAILTSAIVSQEVEQKTIVYLLTRPVQRWQLLIPRYLASVTAVVLVGVFAAICTGLGVYGAGVFGAKLFWNDITAIIFGAFAYGALFLFIGLLVNRAMVVNLLFAFGWETATPNMPGEVYYLSVYSYIKAIAQHPETDSGGFVGLISGALGLNSMSTGTAIGVLVMITIFFLAASAWWFTSFEYVPREDAA
jgi:ABC-2 type transport system permease protein